MWNLKNKQTNKQNKTKIIDTENKMVVAKREGDLGVDQMREWGQEVQTYSYKISHRDVMYSMMTTVSFCRTYLKVAQRINPKS